MFKITPKGNHFQISIGTGKTYPASDLQGVVYALEHYFQQGVAGYSGDKYNHIDHRKHAEQCGCCPLCR